MAAGTYPMVAGDDPVEFVRRLSTAEIALGALLLGRYLTTPGIAEARQPRIFHRRRC
jgi:hypothetical protein